jgi:hypothetical protein
MVLITKRFKKPILFLNIGEKVEFFNYYSGKFMKTVNDVVITEEIRAKYAKNWITNEGTIRSFEYIKAQTTERLQSLIVYDKKGEVNYKAKALKQFVSELKPDGSYINYNWVIGEIGEELYTRNKMDESKWLHLQELTS